MNQVLIVFGSVFFASLLTGISVYVGFIHKLRIKVAVLEHKMKSAELRLDRKSSQFDKLQADLADIKADFAEVKGDLKAISQTLNIIKGNKI